MMQIIRGKIESAQKVVLYGPEGIGKSTLASRFPEPLFIDTEGSTKHMDVARLPKPTSWQMLLDEVRMVRDAPEMCGTLVLDTADWAEQLCIAQVCGKAKKEGIEDFGYGKGYIYVAEEFGRLLNLLEEVVERGVNIVVTAHAWMRKFEQPDEMGSYDRWEMKLSKKVGPLVKEWADMVLFANYKTYAVAADDSGKKFKAQGGARVLYTSHHPCWDAKNRHGLPSELPMDYSEIAACIPARAAGTLPPPAPEPAAQQRQAPVKAGETRRPLETEPAPAPKPEPAPAPKPAEEPVKAPPGSGIPKALQDLMDQHGVTEGEIQAAVGKKGYYPYDMPVRRYDPAFIDGVLIAAWPQVMGLIVRIRSNGDLPF